MRYTTDDKSVLNNCAIEPGVTIAKYPVFLEQHYYLWQGAIAPALTSQFAEINLDAPVTAFVVS